MKSHHYLIALAAMSFVGATGCTDADDQDFGGQDVDVSLDPQAGSTYYEPPMGRNGLLPSQFWSAVAQTAYRDMQNYPLKDGTTFVGGVEIPVLRAPSGSPLKTLLATYPKAAKDLIECALSETQSIYDPVNAVEIHGWWGLASNWDAAPISTQLDVQEWLTGCMLARLNAFGVEVNILLEGDTSAIQSSSVWDSAFPYDESTVLGNMFNSTKPITNSTPAFHAYLCRENYLAGACPVDQGAAYASKRICDNSPSICGLIDIGRCDPSAAAAPACIAGSSSQHWKCKQGPAGSFYQFRTVGVQLENPIKSNSCY